MVDGPAWAALAVLVVVFGLLCYGAGRESMRPRFLRLRDEVDDLKHVTDQMTIRVGLYEAATGETDVDDELRRLISSVMDGDEAGDDDAD